MANEVVAAAVDVWAINQNSNQNGNLMEDKPIHLNDGKLLKSDEILWAVHRKKMRASFKDSCYNWPCLNDMRL